MNEYNFSPPIHYEPYTISGRKITVANDGVLPGGTKQRVIERIIRANPADEYVYAGTSRGAAQPALASVCKSVGCRATIFIDRVQPRTALTQRAADFGANIREISGNLKAVQAAASKYANASAGTNHGNKRYSKILLPFGLHDEKYIIMLADALREAWTDPPPARLWLVAGSAMLLHALYIVFPNTKFHVVQVGRTIWPDQINDNTKLYISPHKFWEPASVMPPYNSVATYDAKVWEFVEQHGEDGDYVFNVAADVLRDGGAGTVDSGDTIAIKVIAAINSGNETQIGKLINDKSVDYCYPYKKYAMTADGIRARFARLRIYEANVRSGRANVLNIHTHGDELMYAANGSNGDTHKEYKYILVKDGDYDDYDNISDFCQEHVRVHCRRYDQKQSSMEYWRQNYQYIILTARATYGEVSVYSLRETLQQKHYECNTFKPSLLVGFVKLLGLTNPRIIDISSGWGDRLVGAMAAGAELYVGCDPNVALADGYKCLINLLDPEHADRYITMPVPFQQADLTKDGKRMEFDLCFTSPPYFDLEVYTDRDGTTANQSINGKNVDQWYNDFLLFSLRKALDHIVPGGYLVININNIKSTSRDQHPDYCLRMIRDVSSWPGVQYMGCLPQWTGNSRKSAQPLFIWLKCVSAAS